MLPQQGSPGSQECDRDPGITQSSAQRSQFSASNPYQDFLVGASGVCSPPSHKPQPQPASRASCACAVNRALRYRAWSYCGRRAASQPSRGKDAIRVRRAFHAERHDLGFVPCPSGRSASARAIRKACQQRVIHFRMRAHRCGQVGQDTAPSLAVRCRWCAINQPGVRPAGNGCQRKQTSV